MSRQKNFDPDEALAASIEVFREHGYAGTSAEMLVEAMGIGKQSLYNTFGGKWQLYFAAVERYCALETSAHITSLKSEKTALAGIERMLARVVSEANKPCLGVGSICEFGVDMDEGKALNQIRQGASRTLHVAMADAIKRAVYEGSVSRELDAQDAAGFIVSSIAALRIAARGGAGFKQLHSISALTLRALQ